MSFDNERDTFGNVSDSSHHTQWEGKRAGVLPTDSAEVARHKVEAQRERDEASHVYKDAKSSASTSGDIGLFGGLIAVVAVGLLLALGDSFTTWQRKEQSEVINQRADLYSDFTPLQKWPLAVQVKYSKYTHTSLSEIISDIPEMNKRVSSETKAEYGARIWFAASSHGKDTHNYATTSQKKSLYKKHRWVNMGPLVLEFLRQQCKSGVGVACLDAAKVQAGAIFETTQRFDAVDGDKKALAELPTSGPDADTLAVTELRQRILRGPALHGWDAVESLWQKVKALFS